MAELVLNRISHYSSLIWDWNGTLINDAEIGAEAESELFSRYGIPQQTREERLRNFFMPIEKYYIKMGFDFTKVSYDQIAIEWLEIYERLVKDVPLFEGAAEMLETLKRAGKRQFVLSAAPQAHLNEMVKKHSIEHYFDAIYGLPDNAAESKIGRGRELMKHQQIDPSTAIIIGDTVHDYEVAKALSVDVLLVADGHHSVDMLRGVHHNVLPSRYR